MELTRRGAIRLAGVAGLAVASGAVLAVAPASVAQAAQSGWRWCQQCQGLWFAGNPSHGACPASTAGHSFAGSGNYTLDVEGDPFVDGQSGWVWCNQCQGLWYALNSTRGACPASTAGHAIAGSTSYSLDVNSGSGQANWRWCRQCQGMWFSGNAVSGRCPAPGTARHSLSGSGNYHLDVD